MAECLPNNSRWCSIEHASVKVIPHAVLYENLLYTSDVMCLCCILFLLFFICERMTTIITIFCKLYYRLDLYFITINVYIPF